MLNTHRRVILALLILIIVAKITLLFTSTFHSPLVKFQPLLRHQRRLSILRVVSGCRLTMDDSCVIERRRNDDVVFPDVDDARLWRDVDETVGTTVLFQVFLCSERFAASGGNPVNRVPSSPRYPSFFEPGNPVLLNPVYPVLLLPRN